MTKAIWALLIASAMSTSLMERAAAQPQKAPTPPANLLQLMRGTLYPESNVVFAAQDVNPADVPHAKDPAMATDPLESQFGKWQAVENNALAIAEVADLLAVPGRQCANGLDVPLKNHDWAEGIEHLEGAGMTAGAAAQTKSQDRLSEPADVMTTA